MLAQRWAVWSILTKNYCSIGEEGRAYIAFLSISFVIQHWYFIKWITQFFQVKGVPWGGGLTTSSVVACSYEQWILIATTHRPASLIQ